MTNEKALFYELKLFVAFLINNYLCLCIKKLSSDV